MLTMGIHNPNTIHSYIYICYICIHSKIDRILFDKSEWVHACRTEIKKSILIFFFYIDAGLKLPDLTITV